MQDIVIVDYGMANLRSVQKALERVGHPGAVISSDPNRMAEAAKIVLPGVGAFRDAIARLREADMVAPLVEHIRAGKPFLGICLGGTMFLCAWKMKNLESYGYALTASIIALLPCQYCCVLTLPFAIWALIVLNQPDVKSAFR